MTAQAAATPPPHADPCDWPSAAEPRSFRQTTKSCHPVRPLALAFAISLVPAIAQEIITAREAGIALMDDWLAENAP